MNAVGKGVLIASAVAGLITSGNLVAWAGDKAGSEAVHCTGVNECKGHGACAGAGSACKGQNACKGQGWVEASSAKECTDKGGKVAETPAKH